MTLDDQHEEIGRMYVEREDVRRKLACLENKCRRMEKTLNETAESLGQRRVKGGNVTINRDFPTLDQVREMLDDLSKLQARLRELDNFFASRSGE